jgi:mediator of RNA polymerase II transcription subunit 6
VEVYGEELINRELGAFNSGFEYIIAHSAPPRMFIVHRRTVEAGGKRDKVDAVYWILNERIYPTPSLYDIMANRTVCRFLPLCVSFFRHSSPSSY